MTNSKTIVLVTGGCGFIGSHFVRFQINTYQDTVVINVDKLDYAADLKRLKDIENNPRYRFVKADICQKSVLAPLIKEADYIVNFAAQTHVDKSIKNPKPFIETNILGTFTLLELAKQNRAIKKFVQISTDEVYGPILKDGFSEDAPVRPSNPYSASKASADALAFSYHVTYKIPVIITRTTNNYGPGQYPEKVIPVFVKRALNNEKLPVYGDGLHRRCWLHVVDNCRAIDLVMRKGRPGEIYHIAGRTEITNVELARRILEYLGKPSRLIGFIDDSKIRPGHDRRYSLNDMKIREELHWRETISFKEGLHATIMDLVSGFTEKKS